MPANGRWDLIRRLKIKTQLQETACNGVGWIYLEQRAFTDLIMKFQVPHEMGNFLTMIYLFIKEVNCVL
jgi:hypothetical protein